jgi:hypothetical protein
MPPAPEPTPAPLPPPPPPPAILSLTCDVSELSFRSRSAQRLFLHGGVEHARQSFWMLGSLHGDTPGFEACSTTVALNPDRYFLFTLRHPRLVPLSPARGALDQRGEAEVEFRPTRQWSMPCPVGTTFHHAFVTFGSDHRLVFASNSVSCTIVP